MVEDIVSKFVRAVPTDARYKERLARELKLIEDKNFTKTFLQVKEIVDITSDIPHVIRGSAGSSLVCYLLGITDIDPVAEDLSLARFMHEKRGDNPDIDMDYPYNRREEVFQRIADHFGKEKVARISNHIHYRKKSALKKAKGVLEIAQKIESTFKSFSLHCGGIVISDEGIPAELMLQEGQIYLNKDQVQDRGFVKIDILSNRALAQLADLDQRPLNSYPDGDELAADLLSSGNCLGIIMAQSPAMLKIFRAMRPRNKRDVAFALALLRPAAASNGNKQKILAGQDPILVFDDDAITAFSRILGCSDSDADNYRRAFAKSQTIIMDEVLSMISDEKDRDLVINNFQRLSLYSFCKSHSISYANLVWALAYHKARRPKQFWVTVLNHNVSMYRKWVFFRQAIESGLEINLGRGPWHLDGNIVRCLCPNISLGNVLDYKRHGFWASPEFIEPCFVEHQQEEDGVFVQFAGLIAADRRHRNSEGEYLTFVTVGVENGKLLDLVLVGRHVLKSCDIITGTGILKHHMGSTYVQVADFEASSL